MGSGYSGTEVNHREIVFERIDTDNLSAEFMGRLQTHGKETTLADIEKRRLEEFLHERTKLDKGTPVGNLIGFLIMIIIIAVPLVITFQNGKPALGIGWTVLVAAMMAFFLVLDKIHRNSYGVKVDLVKEGRYKVFTLGVNRKMWSIHQVGKPGNKRTIRKFCLVCNGMSLSVDSITYEAITNQAVIVLFSTDKGTAMDIVPPAELGLTATNESDTIR